MLDDRDYMKQRSAAGPLRTGSGKRGLSGTAMLLIIIVIVYIVQMSTNDFEGRGYFKLYVNIPGLPLFWQVVGFISHIFLHSVIDPNHILFNGISLYIFGKVVENRLGKPAFLRLFLASGIIAGGIWFLSKLGAEQRYAMVGASGAVCGLTAAAAMLAPNMEVLLFMIIPIKMKYLVPGYIIFSILAMKTPGDTAHVAHIGGLLAGFVLMHVLHGNLIRWSPLSFLFRGNGGRRPKRPKKSSRNDDDDVDFKTIDNILDKIGTYGMKSLTKKEKELLDKARKRMGNRK